MRPTPEGFTISFYCDPSLPVISEGDVISNVVHIYAPKSYLNQTLRFFRQSYARGQSLRDMQRGTSSPDAEVPIFEDDVPLVTAALMSYSAPEKLEQRLLETHHMNVECEETQDILSYLRDEQAFVESLIHQFIDRPNIQNQE